MEGLAVVHNASRGWRMLVRLVLATGLFALIAPATVSTAHSAPQPQVCQSAISV